MKINYYDRETFEYRESERDYLVAEHDVKVSVKPGTYYNRFNPRGSKIYLDVESGVAVHAIASFEKWIKTLVRTTNND